MRLIDAEALINALVNACNNDHTKMLPVWIEKQIDDQPVMLKEQEAVKPKKADNPEESEYCCGICGYPLWLDELYCAHCGRRIEWEGR